MSKNILANLITFSRIGLIPLLIASELQGRYFQSLAIMLIIGATDILDGMVARKAGISSEKGKIFDITADFIVIISIFVFWYVQHQVSLYILLLFLFSFVSFIFLSVLKKKIVKNKIGQYTGAACFIGIILIFIGRTYFSAWITEIQNIGYTGIKIFLILSIIENILNIINTTFPVRKK